MRRQVNIAPYGTLTLLQLIGKGSYGQIYKAHSSAHNTLYAIKIISSDSQSDSLTNIEREIKILMSCQHLHIVKCHSVELIDEMVWIVMDYYSRGSLADIMGRSKVVYSEGQIRAVMGQIVEALAYLHDRSIIHRDIKAANILVDDDGNVKVADFGVSTLVSQSHRHTRTGSPLWMSPELLSNSSYSFKTDIWSLGITALELAEGVPPYSHQHPYRAIFSIQAHPPRSLSEPEKWSLEFNSFVSQCLTLDQNKRPSARQLLKHDFFTKKNSRTDLQLKNLQIQVQSATGLQKQKQEQELPQNTGTMILHSSYDSSVWEKNNSALQTLTNENINEGNTPCGTFKIISFKGKQKDKNMDVGLLSQITRAMPAEIRDIQRERNISKQNAIGGDNECIQQLYEMMEEEIKNVRRKYLSKIRALEQKTLITFSQCLKNPKPQSS